MARCKIDHAKIPRISKRANLLKDFEAIGKSCAIKACIQFYLDEEDSFEDEIDDYVAAKLAVHGVA